MGARKLFKGLRTPNFTTSNSKDKISRNQQRGIKLFPSRPPASEIKLNKVDLKE